MIPSKWKSVEDWQRIVATDLNPILNGYPFQRLDAAPASVDPSFTYYDTVLGKVRTWDGAAWQNHF